MVWWTYVWRRALNDQIHLGNVQAARRHIGGHQHLKRAVPEALERDLPLFLGDVSVQRLRALKDRRELHRSWTRPDACVLPCCWRTCLMDVFMESSVASLLVSQKTMVRPWLPLYTWMTSPMTDALWDQWHAIARCCNRQVLNFTDMDTSQMSDIDFHAVCNICKSSVSQFKGLWRIQLKNLNDFTLTYSTPKNTGASFEIWTRQTFYLNMHNIKRSLCSSSLN